MPIRRNKFGVRKDAAGVRGRIYDGIEYHSQLEAKYAARLDLLKHTALDSEKVSEWRRQVPIPLEVRGLLICKYIIDFVVDFADGHTEYHEVKGYETETWRLKWKLAKALYPGFRFVIIKTVR
jgi:hypothetical protein